MRFLRGFLTHGAIILSLMLITFFVLDRFNPAMGFLSSSISKGLLLAAAVISILNAIRLMKQERR